MMRISFVAILIFLIGLSCTKIQYKTIYQPVSFTDKVDLPVKNVILMIGDGMGLPQISAGIYSVKKGMTLEKFPVVGLQKCQSTDNMVNDSAAGATAMACGIKTKNKYLGVDPTGEKHQSILKECKSKGYTTGLVTTSSIVHATPAGFYANQTDRYFYEKIANDFIASEIDLAIGGGKKYFDRRSTDEKDLVKKLKQKGYLVKSFLENDITRYQITPSKKLVFFTADSEPLSKFQGRDYLPFASAKAFNFLSSEADSPGFFLMIEGAQIDWAGHAKNSAELLSEMQDFDLTVAKILKLAETNGNTLVIVTADHETGGATIDPESKTNKLTVNFAGNRHTPQLVPVFAYGPGAHLFSGVYENTEIYHKIRQAMGFSNKSE